MRKIRDFYLQIMSWGAKVFCMKYTSFILAVIAMAPPVVSCFIETNWVLGISQFVIGLGVAVQAFMFGQNSKKEISKVNKRIDELGVRIIDSPEYLYAMVDAEDHVLFCVKTDGTIDWALGVPQPIRKEIERLEKKIDEKNNQK